MENQVDLEVLVGWVDDSEDATYDARQLAERDRDYVDGNQLTPDEVAELEKRGQPIVVNNRCHRKVEFLAGIEKQQRVDPKAYPRNPDDEESAEAATDSIRYVCDNNRYQNIRSRVWENLLVEGIAGAEVVVEERGEEIDIKINRYAFDRLIIDQHSSEPDFSDSKFRGAVLWMDYDDAIRQWPKAKDALEATLGTTSSDDTYDDKPRNSWSDAHRLRVKICLLYYRDSKDEWNHALFTKGGIIEEGVVPYVNEFDETECPLEITSAYVSRDNARYGAVREYISPQDEINKRGSKALHLLNTNQVIMEEGAVDEEDMSKVRQQVARPDGFIKINPGKRFEIITGSELFMGQYQLMQEAKAEIDAQGPNAAMQGKGASSASGKSIIAQQQGGYIEIATLMDRLRQFDLRIYEMVWNRIRQYWTEEKWVRVTDDQKNLKFVGLNRPVTAGEKAMQQFEEQDLPPEQMAMIEREIEADPQSQMVVEISNQTGQMVVDIIIEDAPDSVTIQQEQFEQISNMAMAGVPFPPDLIVEMSQLRNKDEIIAKMTGGGDDPQAKAAAQAQQQMQQEVQQLAKAKAIADIESTRADTAKKMADAQSSMMQLQQTPIEKAQGLANVKETIASGELKESQAMKTRAEVRQVLAQVTKTRVDAAKGFYGQM